MLLLIEIRHNILAQCHDNNIVVKIVNYMLEKRIFKKLLTKDVGVLMGVFKGYGCPKGTQTPCWLRLCAGEHH